MSRFFKAPAGSFFLFGPRGTGKSTWVNQAFPEAKRLDLLDPETQQDYITHPEQLKALVRAGPPSATFVLDEIQKAPALLDVVHLLLEEKKGRRFVLTGSSSRKLKRAGVDLLAGRALRCALHPFMAAELGAAFSLPTALRQGLLPVVWGSADPLKTLASYVALYIREEVQMEGLVRNLAHFTRFLEAVSFSHGAILTVANVARECAVDRRSTDAYAQILDDLLLSFRLGVFSRRAKRELVTHEKFYFFDAGVFRSLRPTGPMDRPEEIDGAALEGLVAQHLRAWNAYDGERHTLSYWRTRWGLEVDFVIYGPRGFWAIEVKNANRVRPADLRGLQAFGEDYPEARLLFLYRGRERLKFGKTLCLPCDEFLLALHPGRCLSD